MKLVHLDVKPANLLIGDEGDVMNSFDWTLYMFFVFFFPYVFYFATDTWKCSVLDCAGKVLREVFFSLF